MGAVVRSGSGRAPTIVGPWPPALAMKRTCSSPPAPLLLTLWLPTAGAPCHARPLPDLHRLCRVPRALLLVACWLCCRSRWRCTALRARSTGWFNTRMRLSSRLVAAALREAPPCGRWPADWSSTMPSGALEGTPHAVPGLYWQLRHIDASSCPALRGVTGSAERIGADGQRYAIHAAAAGPERAQRGGAPTAGGRCVERLRPGPKLCRAGARQRHDNARNNDPQRNQELVFGFDPQARADYGHACSSPRPRRAGGVERFYGKAAKHRYFSGCSKGGREGAWPLPSATPGV